MADSTPTATPSKDTFAAAESSSFQRTVSLHDWWLIRAQNDFQGKRLAVAGSSRKEGARRLFVSAPVVKRYDVFSLETADGIYVNINGFINEQRTLENGFAPEVFNHFLFGFPPNWERYALDCFSKKSTAGTEPETSFPDNATPDHPEILSDGTEKFIPTSLASSEEVPGDSEKPFPEVECNLSKGMSEVNVVNGSGRSRHSARLHNIKVYQQQKQPANTEKSIPTSLASSEEEEAPGNSEKPFHEVECNSSKGMSEVNVVHGSGRSRRSAWLHNIKVYQQQNQPANTEISVPTSLASSEEEEAPGDSEKPFPEVECNFSKGMSEVNVVYGSGRSRRSARLHNSKVYQQQKQPANTEKSIPTSLASSEEEEAPGDSEKPFHEVECNLSKGMSEVNVVHGSGRSRRSARLHNIKVYQQQKQPANAEKSIPTSLASSEEEEAPGDSEKPFHEVECNLSKGMSEVNVVHGSGRSRYSARLHNIKVCQQQKQPANAEKSIPTSLTSSEEASGDSEKPFHEVECNLSKGMNEVNVFHGSDRSRRSAQLHNIKVCPQQKQPASRAPLKHLDEEQSSTSAATENCDGEGMRSYDLGCYREESTAAIDSGMEKSIPTSLVSPEETPEDCEKPFSEDECDVSKEKGVVNVAYGSGGNRRKARARLPNIEVCQRKKQSASASGGPLKHPDKEQSSTSEALENHDGEGLKSPVTPIQSQSKGLVNISSEQLVKKSASRISRSFSTKTKGCYKKKTVTVKTKSVGPKRKMTKSASAVKSSRERDLSHLNKGSKQKISSVSPESLSFKKSRSGRLLLPPLEFWRNQIPVYNADHELTEIHEGTSLVSPCSGSSPSLSRSNEEILINEESEGRNQLEARGKNTTEWTGGI
ncbi:SANT associated [Sesbania bispinosa]|nr:SANT associated [Sesbania bispinosa]